MSSITWTAEELSREQISYQGTLWRTVEAQNQNSTAKLVDTLEEQSLLEFELETTKPPLNQDLSGLHFLLSTPFRYSRTNPTNSRFNRPKSPHGVLYSSEEVETCVNELAFHKFLFFAESPATEWPANPMSCTSFSFTVETKRSLDLTKRPFNQDEAFWTDPIDYDACQTLCTNARSANVDLIRYKSVRDPFSGFNAAVLGPHIFTTTTPLQQRTWKIFITAAGVQMTQEFPAVKMQMDLEWLSHDSRIEEYLKLIGL